MSSLDEIFKGYIITNGKIPVRRYTDPANQYSLEEVQGHKSYGGVLMPEAILVDIDDNDEGKLLLKIIKEKGIKCRVHKTDNGYHAFFKGHHMSSTRTKKANAIGMITDYKLGIKQGISILKLHGVERVCLYDTPELQELPPWLYPISKIPPEFFRMGEGDGRNDALFQYILTLQAAGLTKEESRETIRIINEYILQEPLSDAELDTILRDQAFPSESFYDSKNKLQVRQFEEHFSREVNAIKLDGNLHIFKDGVYVNGTETIRGKMLDFLPDLTFAQRNEVFHRANDRIQENAKRAPASLILFKNGVYNMETDRLEPHNPQYIITNMIPWDYNPNAYSEVMDKTLNRMACNDPVVRDLLEEMVGAGMYRSCSLGGGKAFILLGDASNGKSTFLDVLRYVFGAHNTCSVPIQDLNSRFKTGELFNKTANIADDIADTWVPDPSIVKKAVTGERLMGEFKGLNPFEFDPFATHYISANEMPRIDDKTGAVKRRLHPVLFKAVFSPNDPDFDPFIKQKLKTQESMEYLIKLGINALHRVLKNNKFSSTEEMVKELNAIDEINNPLLGFIDEIGEIGILNHTLKEVYGRYRTYCIECGMREVARNAFVRQINARLKTITIRKMVKGESNKIFVKKVEDDTV